MRTRARAYHFSVTPQQGGRHGEVRKDRAVEGQEGDARTQGREAQKRAFRQEGDEPQAGDRDRTLRSATRRREGPGEEVGIEEIGREEVVVAEIGLEEVEGEKVEREEIELEEIDVAQILGEESYAQEVDIEEVVVARAVRNRAARDPARMRVAAIP